MAHARKLIRHAVVAQIIAANTAAETRVESTQMIPHRRAGDTALGVYIPSETNDMETRTAPREEHRETQVIIEGVVVGASSSAVADSLDDLAEEVEAALSADDTLGGTASESYYVGSDLEVMEDGAKTVGLIRLTYNAIYHQFAPTAVAAPDAFLTADVKTNQSGDVAPADQAEDIVHPEQ